MIETLTLRQLMPTDASCLYALIDANRSSLAKFWWESQTRSVEDSRIFIENALQTEVETGAPTRGLCVDEALIGVGSLHSFNEARSRASAGLWLDAGATGKGYGRQAFRGLLDIAFKELGLEEVSVATRESNAAARAAAASAGFHFRLTDATPTWHLHDGETARTAHYSVTAQEFNHEAN